MEIKDIDYFLAIAGHRSFSLAAQALHISQPALSRYITNLELRLGIPLFRRTGKQLVLTHAGEHYLSHAQKIAESTRLMEQDMKNVALMQRNKLNVGMIRNGRQVYLPQAIAEFRKAYPKVTLHITELLSNDLELGVLNGKHDIGFISEPTLPSGLDTIYLGDNFTLLAIPCNLPQGGQGEARDDLPYPWIDINLLVDVEFVIQDEGSRMRYHVDEIFRRANFVPRAAMFTQSTVDAIRFTELGVGASFITDGYVPYIQDMSKVRLYCVGTPPAKTLFNVISKKGTVISKVARDFISLYMGESIE
jgi:DNA-binding transcriptional LysR family regulator